MTTVLTIAVIVLAVIVWKLRSDVDAMQNAASQLMADNANLRAGSKEIYDYASALLKEDYQLTQAIWGEDAR